MDDPMMEQQIALEVVYADEHLIELEARVGVGKWRGEARAYTTAQNIRAFSEQLEHFLSQITGEVAFQVGEENGIGMIALWFYTTDRARHIACQVRLASQTATEHRPEEVSKLALEASTEPAAVARFMRGLLTIAGKHSGQAVLIVEASA